MKTKLKKFINLIIVFSIVLSNAVYAQSDSVMSDDVKNAIEILRLLDIIPDYYDYNTDISETVTRADFASAVAKLRGISNTDDGIVYYYDVPKTHWAYGEITALTQMGIISGTDEKLFDPDNGISKTAGYRMLLEIMGYGNYAESNGGWPNGYVKLAQETKLTKNLSSGEYITKSDMFLMLFNAMTTSLYEATTVKNGEFMYAVSDDKTLLSEYHNVYYAKGTVTGADYVTLSGKTLSSADKVMIDDVTYLSDISLIDYIGMKVNYFYINNEDDGLYNTIIWANPAGKNNILNITVDNDGKFDSNSYQLSYYEKNRKKSVKLERSLMLIYNGEAVSSGYEEILNSDRYSLKLIAPDNNGYTIGIVRQYENYVVGNIDSDNKVIYDKRIPQKMLSLDEDLYTKLAISTISDKKLDFDDIKEDLVLSVYMSKSGDYVDILVSFSNVSGELSKCEKEDEGYWLYVNDSRYFMPNGVYADELINGRNVVLSLDVYDEAAYIKVENMNNFAAYLISEHDMADDDTIQYKLLREDGVIEKYNCADNIKIDGVRYKDINEAKRSLYEHGELKQQIVLIELNKGNEIRTIDSVTYNKESETSNSLRVSVPMDTNLIWKGNGLLGGKIIVNNDTIIFSVPNEARGSQNKDYQILQRGDIAADEYLTAETYTTADRVGYEKYVVIKGRNNEAYSNNELPIVAEKIYTSLNSDDEAVETVDGYQGNMKVTLMAEEGVSLTQRGINPGVVFRSKHGSGSEIADINVIYDPTYPERYPASTDTNSKYTVVTGYVNDVIDGLVKIGYESGVDFDRIMYTNNIPVLVYDTSTKKNPVSVSLINAAQTYQNVGNDCSKIVMITSYSTPKVFVVYK